MFYICDYHHYENLTVLFLSCRKKSAIYWPPLDSTLHSPHTPFLSSLLSSLFSPLYSPLFHSGIEALRSKACLPDSWVWEKQVRYIACQHTKSLHIFYISPAVLNTATVAVTLAVKISWPSACLLSLPALRIDSHSLLPPLHIVLN